MRDLERIDQGLLEGHGLRLLWRYELLAEGVELWCASEHRWVIIAPVADRRRVRVAIRRNLREADAEAGALAEMRAAIRIEIARPPLSG